METAPRMNVSRLQEGLRSKRFGKSIFFTRRIGSTNEWAKELAKLGAMEGTVTITATQTAGHGRLDREWISPVGGLWFSVILRPRLSVTEAVKIVFVAGLAVAETLHEMYGLRVETKWPNDVLVNEKKICGVLTEMNTIEKEITFVVVGIGINANIVVEKVFPAQMQESTTSLESELRRKVLLEELFWKVIEVFETKYDSFMSGEYLSLFDKWKSYARFLGRRVDVAGEDESFIGLALDVDRDGALLVKREDGTIERVLAGDVTVRVK